MKLRISVRKKHIKKGVRNSTYMCPIARAVREKGFKRIDVSGCTIMTRSKVFFLPKVASRFINMFDEGQVVKPFSFTAIEA